MMHTISDWGHRAEGISLVYLLCVCICHMELNLYLIKDWVQRDNFGPTFVLGVFSSKGFQLSSSLLQLLLTHPFPYCGLLVAIKWNLMLFLNRIALLRAEKLHRAVRWGPSWTSQNVLHLSSQEECSETCMRESTASRVGCWKETVPHKRGGWKLYPCHTEYGANAWEERGWAAGELLKSWTKISITNKL